MKRSRIGGNTQFPTDGGKFQTEMKMDAQNFNFAPKFCIFVKHFHTRSKFSDRLKFGEWSIAPISPPQAMVYWTHSKSPLSRRCETQLQLLRNTNHVLFTRLHAHLIFNIIIIHHFWQAPLRVRSAERRHQSPEWTVLRQVNCVIHIEVAGFQILLNGFHPCNTRTSQLSPPVSCGGSC